MPRSSPLRPARVAGLAAAAVALLPSCVTFSLSQHRLFQEPPPDRVERLEVGGELAEALELLGAPALVAEDGDGAILTWSWDDGDAMGFNVQLPLGDSGSVSFNWLDTETLAHRLRLRYDSDWRLVQVIEEGE